MRSSIGIVLARGCANSSSQSRAVQHETLAPCLRRNRRRSRTCDVYIQQPSISPESIHGRPGKQRVARHGEDSRGSPALIAERRAFGERLRRQRRHKNLSLTEIAASTKVGASHYAALERGDCSRWPGGVYNRAFIRAYAKAVDLDPDETAAEFAEYFESAPPPVDPQAVAGLEVEGPSRPPLRLGIEPDPYEAEKRFVRIAALLIVDLLAVVALAATGMLFTAASFWICLGCASIGYQMASRVVRSIPRSKGSVKVPTATSTHVEHPEPAQS